MLVFVFIYPLDNIDLSTYIRTLILTVNIDMGRIVNTEIFIRESTELHGGKYDYRKTVYTETLGFVIIICPIHGEFTQRASSHLSQGNGCKQCADDKRRDGTEDFIAKARLYHGDRFDYSKVDYKSSHKKVIITCPIHGDFEQMAYLHIQHRACRKCKYLKHPGGYSYDLFRQKPNLAKTPGVFYVVEYTFPNERFIKIGITRHNAYTRHKSHWKNVRVLAEEPMTLYEAFHKEQVLLHKPLTQSYRYTPKNLSAGVTECFTPAIKPMLL